MTEQQTDNDKDLQEEIHSETAVKFDIPSWAGKPPMGYHLDVMKGEKLIQKLMIDEKRCYYFGRNPKLCDFSVDHASCSRVHAVLVYHKHLKRTFLVDLGSTHGTFIGSIRLEAGTPQQLLSDQKFHFGASTRLYMLREKPKEYGKDENKEKHGELMSSHLGLPEKEEELENLTEYNTALNRRIAAIAIPEDSLNQRMKRKKSIRVFFSDEEDIINPEDVDPSVGRFRNLVTTTVIPAKRSRSSSDDVAVPSMGIVPKTEKETRRAQLPQPPSYSAPKSHLAGFGPISAKLGLSLSNPAPDVDLYAPELPVPAMLGFTGNSGNTTYETDPNEPKKKKYAKEAWPGKKPAHLI